MTAALISVGVFVLILVLAYAIAPPHPADAPPERRCGTCQHWRMLPSSARFDRPGTCSAPPLPCYKTMTPRSTFESEGRNCPAWKERKP